MIVIFFSSRRRHTRYWRDWSSDVCSSDLVHAGEPVGEPAPVRRERHAAELLEASVLGRRDRGLRLRADRGSEEGGARARLEERRGGKEGRSRGSTYH